MSNANEQAFPALAQSQCRESGETTDHETVGGLTKLEYFAGMAMQGLCANPVTLTRSLSDGTCVTNSFLADLSVSLAYALIAELEKVQKP